jgi:integrase
MATVLERRRDDLARIADSFAGAVAELAEQLAGVPMRTLQEWMGHRDIATTQRYADYAPSAHEAALVAAAFGSARDLADAASGV